MKISPAVKPAIWGGVLGAVAMMVVGFSWGGWTTASSAERATNAAIETAVVKALAPICVDRFKQDSDATAMLARLKKASSWEQSSLIEKGGWASTSGGAVIPAVAKACGDILANAKS